MAIKNESPDIASEILGIKFKSPVLAASGTFGYGHELKDIVPLKKIGGIITKTVTINPKEGNPSPRICETAAGMLNTIGLQNIGVDRFVSEKLPKLAKLGSPVIVSIAGETAEDYVKICKRLNGAKGISAIELNLSCPNLKKRIVCQDEGLVREILISVKNISRVPVIAKLSPQVMDIGELAKLCENCGADAVNVTNTFPGMAVDIQTWRPKLSTVTGGLSGPCIKPLALRCVWLTVKAVKIPVIGGGGISGFSDALEFILAGASLVSVGTAFFVEPKTPELIAEGIKAYMKQRGIKKLNEIVGRIII